MIQFMDNFSFYGTDTGNMLDGLPWADIAGTLVADPDVGSTGNVLRVMNDGSTNNNYEDTRIALPTPANVVGCTFRFYMASLPASNGLRPTLCSYRLFDNVPKVDFLVEPNGSLSAYNNNGSGTLSLIATTGSPVMAPNSWFHYEFKLNATTGAFEVRIEGFEVLTGTATALGGNIAILGMSSRQAGNTNPAANYMKDFIVWDGTGSQNNNFIGTVAVYMLMPNTDVTNGWALSTGTSWYQLVDEETPDDTDYVSADDTLPAACVMGFEDLPSDIVAVRAIETLVRAKKTDGGDAQLNVSLVSNAVETAGTDHPLTTAYKYWLDISELDPDTAATWDPIAVNDAYISLDRVL